MWGIVVIKVITYYEIGDVGFKNRLFKEWEIRGNHNKSGLHPNPTPEQRKEFADLYRKEGINVSGSFFKQKKH